MRIQRESVPPTVELFNLPSTHFKCKHSLLRFDGNTEMKYNESYQHNILNLNSYVELKKR